MYNQLDHLLTLIAARVAALHAAEQHPTHRADYLRRAEHYALAIRVCGEGMVTK